MPIYIDAKQLEKQVKEALGKINPYLMGQMLRWIRNQTTIDAVEVVRCGECKHHEDEEIGMVYCPNAIGGWVSNEWFCADGERKECADNG